MLDLEQTVDFIERKLARALLAAGVRGTAHSISGDIDLALCSNETKTESGKSSILSRELERSYKDSIVRVELFLDMRSVNKGSDIVFVKIEFDATASKQNFAGLQKICKPRDSDKEGPFVCEI